MIHAAVIHAAAADPTGLSSVTGRLVMVAGLIAVLILLLLQWRRRR